MILFNNLGRFIVLNICLCISCITFATESIGRSLQLSTEQHRIYSKKGMNLLGIYKLDDFTADGKELAEFSGLAWDRDEKILYALSDRGYLLHIAPIIEDNKLFEVRLKGYYKLRDQHGKYLSGPFSDSEGLALLNADNNKKQDAELIVSFERKPRIVHYSPKGEYIKQRDIGNRLKDISNYRSANKSLEAITEHSEFDLIFSPERPLKNSEYLISIHSINNKNWHFLPDNKKYGSLVGLTTLPDNRIIALERSFPGVFAGLTTTLHLLELDQFSIQQEMLFQLKPTDGFFNDNFEGISWHEDNRFFMISDDNDNAIQRSLLIYFEITDL